MSFLASNSYNTGTRTSAGQWYNSGSGLNDGFAGFAFTDGTAQTHYGWARISVAPYTDGDLDSLAITLKDIAYESDANTAIAAGATGIPENSPVNSLVVFGLGGVGVQILRQRQSRRLAKNKPQTPESWEKLALGTSSVSQNS